MVIPKPRKTSQHYPSKFCYSCQQASPCPSGTAPELGPALPFPGCTQMLPAGAAAWLSTGKISGMSTETGTGSHHI